MTKTLTTVGNSKALILPKRLIDKYHLDHVTIHEVEQGILIKPVTVPPSFQDQLAQLRENKQQIYATIKQQAEEAEIIAYYNNEALPDIDLDVADS